MTQVESADSAVSRLPRRGRKRDHTRDAEILEATLDTLAEKGYEGMTIDMVAARAKAGKATLYRRWPSKPELVLDAVACLKKDDIDPAALPDTGTLRGDLVAMFKSRSVKDLENKLKIMASLVSMLSRNPEFADAAREALIEPRLRAYGALVRRAVDRGEIPARSESNLDLIFQVFPAMMSFRGLLLHRPPNREDFIEIIDAVILPALGQPANPA